MCDRTVVLDSHGDTSLQLRNGTQLDPTIYITCSRALARASPILRAQLRGQAVSDDPKLQHALQIKGHDDESLAIFLNIVHAHFLAVPRTVDVGQMYNLTILTSNYRCSSILGPWIDAWISGIREKVRESDMAMMLWVFWELGLEDDFHKMARRMVVNLDARKLMNDGRLWGSRKTARVMDQLCKIRLQSLQALFDATKDMLENMLVSVEVPKWSRFATRSDPRRCRRATCAMMESSLDSASLWPLPETTEVQESVTEVYSKLAAVTIHNHMGCEFGHFWCRRMQDALNSQLDQIKTLWDSHEDSLADVTELEN
ncbi:hypothetical protein V2A60_010277 [Cordyceps javanica]|uniref:Nuclear pore protein n=1 Tax=Cordyceps javanica TaxID=43265 RepID=A0A545VUE9_9HYPO|nr:nuclear pore protein [Cordyceps javanica]TQW05350.1 nuclear pore protein [Cordyceps javanica]